MGHIFISYNHKDSDYAQKLADALHARGIDVWIDARLDYGSQWPHEIQKQLDSCSAFILLMSPRAFASDWVQSELQRAKRKSKPIFPLLLEGDGPWLSVESTQYYDVRDRKMPDSRFFGALSKISTSSQSVATGAPLPHSALRPESKSRTWVWIVVTGGLAALFLATVCAAFIFLPPLLNRPTEPSPEPTTFVITETEFVTDIPMAIPATEMSTRWPTNTPPPTSTSPPPTFTPIPPTAAPIAISTTYNIAQYGGEPGTQRSPPLDYVVTVRTVDLLQIEFSVPSDVPSSDVILHILLDGDEIYTSDPIGGAGGRYTTQLIDLSGYVSEGSHTLTISPEGVFGGGNLGYLSAWGGTLVVRTNIYP